MKLGRPAYLGTTEAVHGQAQPVGVLLANLGSPAAPTAAALRPYLRQFLSDPRVIEWPRLLWWFILNGIIVPLRAPKSAAAYRAVWDAGGSPLLALTRRQASAITQQLDPRVRVVLGMSYGSPSIGSALRELHAANCRRIAVLPLYPQYAASTVGAVFDAVARELASWRWVPELRFVSGYCQQPAYTKVLADSIRSHQAAHGTPDLTLFSFHGIQLAALEAGDPYHCHCHRTARETATVLGWEDRQWQVAFQSRFGSEPWLQPATIEEMHRLPGRGIKRLQVVCPAFAADCLETLGEICGENKEAFLAAGGTEFSYIPALNDTPAHVAFLANLVRSQVADWLANPAQPSGTGKQVARVRPLTTGQDPPGGG